GNFLYIADSGNNRVRKWNLASCATTDANGFPITPSTGCNMVTTVAGGGSPRTGVGDGGAGLSATLNFPSSVWFDAAGNLYIADRVNSKIRKIDAYGNMSNAVSSNSITISRTGVIGGNTPASGYAGDGGPAVLDKIGALSGAAGQQHLVNPTVSPRPDIVAA